MSGVALTYAFSARPYDILPAIMRRLIRLGVPIPAASILLAAALFSLLPDAQEGTLQQTHSVWFGQTAPRDVSPMAITHQIAFEGLLQGTGPQACCRGGWMSGSDWCRKTKG